MALVLQEVLTLPVHLSPPPGFAEFVLLKIFGFDFVDHCNCFMYLSNESKDELNINFVRKVNRNGHCNTELKIDTHYGHTM
jgi:hypothetical protein